jgi:DedD protein
MERATQERLVGAVILVVAVVALVPAILTGPKPPPAAAPQRESAIKSLEIDLAPAPAPSDLPVPEPAAIAARPEAASPPAGAAPAPPSGLPGRSADALAKAPPSTPAARTATTSPAEAESAPTAAGPVAAWAVQLGAFAAQTTAEKLVGELRGRGYPAFIVEYRADGRVLHRVRVGPEQDRARADALAARLAKDGYPGTVARHP